MSLIFEYILSTPSLLREEKLSMTILVEEFYLETFFTMDRALKIKLG